MGDDSRKIKIDDVQGGDSRDQDTLKRNYFLPTEVNDTYQFFTPDDELIETKPAVVATGCDFSFTLKDMPEVIWMVSRFEISRDQASGNWTNNRQLEADEGHFQAQAGGGGVEQMTSSVTAG